MRSFVLVLLCGCGVVLALSSSSLARRKIERWDVYTDAGARGNHGEWTNFMPEEGGRMIKMSLVDKVKPHSGDTCIRVEIRWQEPNWCGLVVSCLPDYWGDKPARAFDLKGYRKLVFHARGERGGECIQIKAALAGDKKFGDSAKMAAATEWLTLKKERWTRFELDVSECDLTRVVTPFCFVSSKDYNADPIIFYLDEIYFEK